MSAPDPVDGRTRRHVACMTALYEADEIAEHMRLDPELAMARLFPGRTGAPIGGTVRG